MHSNFLDITQNPLLNHYPTPSTFRQQNSNTRSSAKSGGMDTLAISLLTWNRSSFPGISSAFLVYSHHQDHYMGYRGTPKWMVYFMENLIKMDDLGGKPTIFGNRHIFRRGIPINSYKTLPFAHYYCLLPPWDHYIKPAIPIAPWKKNSAGLSPLFQPLGVFFSVMLTLQRDMERSGINLV